ncbi:MAG: histidine kinase [Xanthomonadales bacterium]|jgi:two-component system LytT family sensor kinase|nr:histidine kinase [Xanthomonadales bacterium]
MPLTEHPPRIDPVRARVRRKRLAWGLFFLSSALGAVLFIDRYLSRIAGGKDADILRVLIEELSSAYSAALLVPLMVWLARRWPVMGAGWSRRIGLHLPFAALTGMLHTTLNSMSRWALIYLPGIAEVDYLPTVQRYLLSLPNQMIVYGLVIAITHTIDRYRAARNRELDAERMRAHLTLAQLDALRRQLEPHFLFTTLNAVSTLIYSKPAAAEEMIARLSSLLKHAFSPEQQHETSLAEELRLLDLYLDIMRLRFDERLFVQIDIPEELRHARVPRLLLQPLVDAALRRSADPSKALVAVKLVARADHGRLILRVSDQSDDSRIDVGDIGLDNARQRIRRMYGEQYDLRREAAVLEGSDTIVEMPLNTEKV